MRLDGLETILDAVSNDMTSSMMDIDNKLESQSVKIKELGSNMTKLHQKINKLELEDIPFLKKDRINRNQFFIKLECIRSNHCIRCVRLFETR